MSSFNSEPSFAFTQSSDNTLKSSHLEPSQINAETIYEGLCNLRKKKTISNVADILHFAVLYRKQLGLNTMKSSTKLSKRKLRWFSLAKSLKNFLKMHQRRRNIQEKTQGFKQLKEKMKAQRIKNLKIQYLFCNKFVERQYSCIEKTLQIWASNIKASKSRRQTKLLSYQKQKYSCKIMGKVLSRASNKYFYTILNTKRKQKKEKRSSILVSTAQALDCFAHLCQKRLKLVFVKLTKVTGLQSHQMGTLIKPKEEEDSKQILQNVLRHVCYLSGKLPATFSKINVEKKGKQRLIKLKRLLVKLKRQEKVSIERCFQKWRGFARDDRIALMRKINELKQIKERCIENNQ